MIDYMLFWLAKTIVEIVIAITVLLLVFSFVVIYSEIKPLFKRKKK